MKANPRTVAAADSIIWVLPGTEAEAAGTVDVARAAGADTYWATKALHYLYYHGIAGKTRDGNRLLWWFIPQR